MTTSPSAWTRTSATHFRRTVSTHLLEALAPSGPLDRLLAFRAADPALRDLQLRREPKGSASWASLYVGLTSVLDVVERGGQFLLRAHGTYRASTAGWLPKWEALRPLNDLVEDWPDVLGYLDAVVGMVNPRWTDVEGAVHALIVGSSRTGFDVVNREASISFRNRAALKNALAHAYPPHAVRAAWSAGAAWQRALAASHWGTSPDVVAVDDQGRLLVVEAKPASAASGITRAPVQVAVYAGLWRAWLHEHGEAARDELEGQLAQRRRLGLLASGGSRRLAWPPVVVPVVAIGPGVVSPEVWARVAAVADSLSPPDGVEPLEVLRLAGDGTPRVVALTPDGNATRADTDEDRRTSSYQDRARAHAVAWKLAHLAGPARQDGPYGSGGDVYPFCLPAHAAEQNLFPAVRGAVGLFRSQRIQWHRGTSGGPTTHLLSSQVQCVNALEPLRRDASALRRAFAGLLDIAEVLPIDGEDLLAFEYNGGGTDLLHEAKDARPLTRGANSTSTDAAFRYRDAQGRIVVALVEWKYTERYFGAPLASTKNPERVRRYADLFADGPFRDDLTLEQFFAEPLYQLMRQQLLAWRIERSRHHGATRSLVVHVCPVGNTAYQRSLDRHALNPDRLDVLELWPTLLRPEARDRFLRVPGEHFQAPEVTGPDYVARYAHP